MQQAPGVGQDPPRLELRKAESVYERVRANDETLYAYFNSSKRLLYGDPHQDELRAVEKLLEEASIAYPFNPDENRRRPLFRSNRMTGVGLEGSAQVVLRPFHDLQPADTNDHFSADQEPVRMARLEENLIEGASLTYQDHRSRGGHYQLLHRHRSLIPVKGVEPTLARMHACGTHPLVAGDPLTKS